MLEETVHFGTVGGKPSFLTLSGACAGDYALSAAGSLSGQLPRLLLPDIVDRSSGSVDLPELYLAGNLQSFDEENERPYFDRFEAGMTFGRKATSIQLDFDQFTLRSGAPQAAPMHRIRALRQRGVPGSHLRLRGLLR